MTAKEMREIIDVAGIAQMTGASKDGVKHWRARYDDFPKPINDNKRHPIYSRAQFTNWYAAKWPERAAKWPVRLHRIFIDGGQASAHTSDMGPIEEARGYLRAVRDLKYGDWRVWATSAGFVAEKANLVHIWALDTSLEDPEEWYVYMSRFKAAGTLDKERK